MATTYAELINSLEREISRDRDDIQAILDAAQASGRTDLTRAEDMRCEVLLSQVEQNKRKLENIRAAKAEDDEADRLAQIRRPNPALPKRDKPAYDQVARIGSEPHTYSRDMDPAGKGEQFISDVLSSYRGNGAATERLARHMREYETDNPRFVQRAAGDALVANFLNLIVPQYLVAEYAAKPSNVRPFADAMNHRPLPAEGMTVELSVGNTTTTAALQAAELTAPAGTSHDDNPLELAVQTAMSWQQVSRQAIDRGRVTEQIIMDDLLDGMHSLIEDTVLNQATHGLFAVATRNEYDSASPTAAELYPKILAAASKSQAVLKNKGKPNFVLMHPRRWYWLQAQVTDTWPAFGQPGIDPAKAGQASATPYGQSPNGLLPAGLDVIESFAVKTAILDGAATGGDEDSLFVGDTNRALLYEAPEVFIRAEQPLATALGLQIVVYSYFAYTYEQYANAFQAINGTGTSAPSGF